VSRFLKVLAIIGIFADAFILAFDVSSSRFHSFFDPHTLSLHQYFEQKEQMENLDKAIKDLYAARIIAKLYSSMCDTIKTQVFF